MYRRISDVLDTASSIGVLYALCVNEAWCVCVCVFLVCEWISHPHTLIVQKSRIHILHHLKKEKRDISVDTVGIVVHQRGIICFFVIKKVNVYVCVCVGVGVKYPRVHMCIGCFICGYFCRLVHQRVTSSMFYVQWKEVMWQWIYRWSGEYIGWFKNRRA